jgi:hypothetical protein
MQIVVSKDETDMELDWQEVIFLPLLKTGFHFVGALFE